MSLLDHQWTIGDAPYPRVQGAHGARYRVGPLCAMPTCRRMADAAHHLWGRGFMGKAWDWILVEGVVVPNLLPLCWQHHEDVTGSVGGYKAGIRYEPESGCLFWVDSGGEAEMVWGTSQATKASAEEPELCTECGRRKPRKRDSDLPKGERRPKTKVVLVVPKDRAEDGAEALEDLFSQVKEKYGRPEDEPPYYSVHMALYEALTGPEYDGEGPCPTCGNEVVL